MQITIPLSKINRVLGVLLASLALAGILAEILRHLVHSDSPLVQWFSLSEEANVPTWYSSFLLLSCSFVLAAIAAVKKRAGQKYRRHWIGLSVIFLYMSIDELAQIHEWLNESRYLKGLHGILYFSWVIPAGALVLLFALSYLRFLFHLPPRTRFRAALAGFIYVGGALGVELVLGKWTDIHGEANFTYAMIDVVEESMEILGASLFLSTLVEYLGGIAPDLRLAIKTEDSL